MEPELKHNNEHEVRRTGKEEVVAYVKLLSHRVFEGSDENNRKTYSNIAGLLAEN
jgi:hypothetical protein